MLDQCRRKRERPSFTQIAREQQQQQQQASKVVAKGAVLSPSEKLCIELLLYNDIE